MRSAIYILPLLLVIPIVYFLVPSFKTFYKAFRKPLLPQEKLERGELIRILYRIWMIYSLAISTTAVFTLVIGSLPLFFGKILVRLPKPYPFYFPPYPPLPGTKELTMGGIAGGVLFASIARILALRYRSFLVDTLLFQALTTTAVGIWVFFIQPDALTTFSDRVFKSFPDFPSFLFIMTSAAVGITESLCWYANASKDPQKNNCP